MKRLRAREGSEVTGMTYATAEDVESRTTQIYSQTEREIIGTLLEDAAVMIDACAPAASDDAKKVVSCRMVIRAMGGDAVSGVPLGATQGSMTAGPYTQSWTVGSGGSLGELYIGKTERALLGCGNRIGSYSPVQEMAVTPCD